MIKSVKPFAHVPSLAKLTASLVLSQWELEDSNCASVDDEPPFPGWQNVAPGSGREVAISHVQQVRKGEANSSETGGLWESLTVIHPIDDGLILLPIVIIHFLFIYSRIKLYFTSINTFFTSKT